MPPWEFDARVASGDVEAGDVMQTVVLEVARAGLAGDAVAMFAEPDVAEKRARQRDEARKLAEVQTWLALAATPEERAEMARRLLG